MEDMGALGELEFWGGDGSRWGLVVGFGGD